jgi:hypothetical protein
LGGTCHPQRSAEMNVELWIELVLVVVRILAAGQFGGMN